MGIAEDMPPAQTLQGGLVVRLLHRELDVFLAADPGCPPRLELSACGSCGSCGSCVLQVLWACGSRQFSFLFIH